VVHKRARSIDKGGAKTNLVHARSVGKSVHDPRSRVQPWAAHGQLKSSALLSWSRWICRLE